MLTDNGYTYFAEQAVILLKDQVANPSSLYPYLNGTIHDIHLRVSKRGLGRSHNTHREKGVADVVVLSQVREPYVTVFDTHPYEHIAQGFYTLFTTLHLIGCITQNCLYSFIVCF